ncbi:MAG TPA: hypothetical protein VHY19_13480 [Steroidobacteraceae bacterium]|jgi:hypothetical protein|nr:hypothetical protein [Steroidobacteraceae bacterium]
MRTKKTVAERPGKNNRGPGSKGKIEKIVRNSLAKELLGVCFSSLRRQGLSTRDLNRFAKESLKQTFRVSPSRLLMHDISCLGRLISEWTENSRYLDATGRPRVLAITGKTASFDELARKHFDNHAVENVIKFAMKFKALERVGKHSVAHLGSCVLLTGNRTLLLSHAVRAVKWLLATSEYNGRRLQATPWPERLALTELPEEKFAEFLQFMREPIINLVDMGNRWLMANAAFQGFPPRDRIEKKGTLVGVHAYVFRDT